MPEINVTEEGYPVVTVGCPGKFTVPIDTDTVCRACGFTLKIHNYWEDPNTAVFTMCFDD